MTFRYIKPPFLTSVMDNFFFVKSMRHFTNRPDIDPEYEWSFNEYISNTRSGSFPTLAEFLKGKETVVKPYFDFDMKFSMTHGSDDPPDDAPNDAEIKEMVVFLVSVIKSLFTNEERNYRIAVAHRKPASIVDKGKQWWKVSLRFFVVGLRTRKDLLKTAVKNLNSRYVMTDDVLDKLKNYVEQHKGEIFDSGVYDDNRKMNCLLKSKTVQDKRYLLPYDHDVTHTFTFRRRLVFHRVPSVRPITEHDDNIVFPAEFLFELVHEMIL